MPASCRTLWWVCETHCLQVQDKEKSKWKEKKIINKPSNSASCDHSTCNPILEVSRRNKNKRRSLKWFKLVFIFFWKIWAKYHMTPWGVWIRPPPQYKCEMLPEKMNKMSWKTYRLLCKIKKRECETKKRKKILGRNMEFVRHMRDVARYLRITSRGALWPAWRCKSWFMRHLV